MVNKAGEWGLIFQFDGLVAELQNWANGYNGIGVSNYYIVINGEGKLEGEARRSRKIQYETVGKSVNICKLGWQND